MSPRRAAVVMQFKVTLREVSPRVWRRIQVPETYSFWDLHVAIQDAMGWLDYHLHEFTLTGPEGEPVRVGIPGDDDWQETPCLDGNEEPLSRYFGPHNKKALYAYDFGDDWQHDVVFEKTLPGDPLLKYPLCVDGKRRCPPEDCGGSWGYQQMLRALANPRHSEHQEWKTWAGRGFDPEKFDAAKVKFDNPKTRWKIAFESGGR